MSDGLQPDGSVTVTIDTTPQPIQIYRNGKLIGTSRGFSSKPLAKDPATVHVLPRVYEGAIDYIKFELVGEFTIEAPRRDPCPYHYTGDPELPCRCPKPPPSPYDVVIDGVDG